MCSCIIRVSFRFTSSHFHAISFPKLTIFTILRLRSQASIGWVDNKRVHCPLLFQTLWYEAGRQHVKALQAAARRSSQLRAIYMACKMWKITALTWETSSWRLVEQFHNSAFTMYHSLYNWIGKHEITKLKKLHIRFESRKKTQKQAQKDTNEMEWHKMDYLIF